MAKKDSKTIIFIIILVVAVIVISQIGIFKPSSGKTEVPKGTTQGGLSLSACVLNEKKECITEDSTFSVVTFFGKTPTPGARWVRIFSTMTAGGTAPYIDIEDVTGTTTPGTGSPNIYDEAIESDMNLDFRLSNPGIDEQYVDFDVTDTDVPFGNTEYKMTILASFDDAGGNRVVLTGVNEPIATVNIDKSVDICWPTDSGPAGNGDSTTWGECSLTKPKYCEPGKLADFTISQVYEPGTMVYKATECLCPAGEEPKPGFPDECIDVKCSDGTLKGECIGHDALYCQDTPMGQPGVSVEDCTQCGQDGTKSGGTGTANCHVDFHSNPAITCNTETNLCEYTAYTGLLDLVIGSS